MRIATNKKGGSVASPGSVLFNFEQKGVIQVKKEGIEEDDLFLLATDAGAEDFEAADDLYMITTAPDLLYEVKGKLEAGGITCEEANLEMIPKVNVECDPETAKANMELIEWLEGLEDVDSVYHNML
jgi:transcriptional/translational regulatory protein YebC/TACO1